MPRSFLVPLVWFALATAGALHGNPIPSVGVGVVRSVAWSPGDTVREGAGEFLVLLQAARLKRISQAAGLLAVGDHNGVLRAGGERALRRLAVTGVVIVRLAPGGEVASIPDNVFVDAGPISEETAGRVLALGLRLFGSPPVAAEPDQPSARELAAIRLHLQNFQELFAREPTAALAAR